MNVLKRGSSGGDVRVLQKLLGLSQDGKFGPLTQARAIEWQASHGLVPDGIVGNNTWRKIAREDAMASGKVSDGDLILVAVDLNVELASIKAIAEVESCGAAMQNGVPTMLFEGHVFWRQLKLHGIDPEKVKGDNEDILYKSWTKKWYTGKNYGEYARLRKAIQIDEQSAYESASYGMFQIMGNNYRACGYSSAKAMFDDMCKSEDAHLVAFSKFIKASNIVPWLQKRDWKKVAYMYNGPSYASNKYDVKLKAAYDKYSK